MIVNYHHMGGEELKRIYEISGLNSDLFAERLGISRAKLYTQFKQKTVDHEIQQRVIGDPELAKNRQLFRLPGEEDTAQKTSGPGMELLAKSMEMINETLLMVKDSLRIISDDNKFIKEDAEIYRTIVKEGMSQGAIKFIEPKRR